MTTETDYSRTDGAITATAIKAGATSMLAMHAAMQGHGKEQTAAMAWGGMVHAAILEPDRFWGRVAVWAGERRAGAEWKAFEAANAGKEIIRDDDRLELERLIDAVYSKPAVAELLRATKHEQTREWTDVAYGRGKCRLDGIGDKVWLELKTTAATSRRAYAAQHYNLGYDMQLGWYSIGAGDGLPCRLVTVCTGDIPDVVLYHVPRAVIAAGRDKAVEIARRYRACEAAGVFPGADCGEEEVEFVPPTWAGGRGVEEVDLSNGTMEASEL